MLSSLYLFSRWSSHRLSEYLDSNLVSNLMRPCLPILAKSRSGSSSRWLARARSDPFRPTFSSDSDDGPASLYVARSAYKLVQLDDKHRFLRPGCNVLELGAAPGGWSQVCTERMKSEGKIVAIDLLELDPRVAAAGQEKDSILHFIRGDIREPHVQETIDRACRGRVDVVLSDMLANTTGNSTADSASSLELCQLVFGLAERYLQRDSDRGGTMVVKLLQSGEADDWRKSVLQNAFRSVKIVKPTASRAESREQYIVARGLR